MTVDRELIATRVAKIREQLRHLSRLDAVSRDAFLASTTEQHAVERELQIVIEACLDIGHHVISREGLRRPGDYRDVSTVLREAAIVEAELGRRLEEMASFRNRLVHGYEQSAAAKNDYHGKTYYFCSPACKAAFDKNPEKYAAK